MPYRGFELWDLDSGNAIERFDTEQEAPLAVLDALVRYGFPYVEYWALAEVTDNTTNDLGVGRKLVDRAITMVMDAAGRGHSAVNNTSNATNA
jgi:hypothetical protein